MGAVGLESSHGAGCVQIGSKLEGEGQDLPKGLGSRI